MRDVVFVAAARPNFMKIAPILRAFGRDHSGLAPVLVHTGQHYDTAMSDVFFEQLRIRRPDVSLGVGSGTHGEQMGRTIIAFEKYLLDRQTPPAGVVVVGDVNATASCALAAVKLGVRVAHVEAGLRSFDRTMPEEINRLVTDAIADLLLVTEESAVRNLEREGIPADKVHMVGNVMIDTLLQELPAARATDFPNSLGLQPKGYGVVTLHRPSNVDSAERLERLVAFLHDVSQRLPLVFPVHPRTRIRLQQQGLLGKLSDSVRVLDPLGYHQNVALLADARFVVTDSGGMQEETAVLRVPCLTIRPNTERYVTVDLGTSTLVGDDIDRARTLVDSILESRYKEGSDIPFWDGHASERVVKVLAREWGER